MHYLIEYSKPLSEVSNMIKSNFLTCKFKKLDNLPKSPMRKERSQNLNPNLSAIEYWLLIIWVFYN